MLVTSKGDVFIVELPCIHSLSLNVTANRKAEVMTMVYAISIILAALINISDHTRMLALPSIQF